MNSDIQYTSYTREDVYGLFYRYSHTDGTYTAYIRGKRCVNAEAIFKEMSAALQFPYYFGENWAALDECIQDLEWLPDFQTLVLVVDDFSAMTERRTKELFVEIVSTAASYWRAQGKMCLVYLNR